MKQVGSSQQPETEKTWYTKLVHSPTQETGQDCYPQCLHQSSFKYPQVTLLPTPPLRDPQSKHSITNCFHIANPKHSETVNQPPPPPPQQPKKISLIMSF